MENPSEKNVKRIEAVQEKRCNNWNTFDLASRRPELVWFGLRFKEIYDIEREFLNQRNFPTNWNNHAMELCDRERGPALHLG